jgi:hypothetical protein
VNEAYSSSTETRWQLENEKFVACKRHQVFWWLSSFLISLFCIE